MSVTSQTQASLTGGEAVRQVKTSLVGSSELWGWCILSAGRAAAGLDGGMRAWAGSIPPSFFYFFGCFFAATRPVWIHCQFQLHTWLPSDWQAAANLKPSLLWVFHCRWSGGPANRSVPLRRAEEEEGGEKRRFGEFDWWKTRTFDLRRSVYDTKTFEGLLPQITCLPH